jgi:phosphoribulokinase
MLGIAGDSAAGKTTFTDGLLQILGHGRVGVMCTDDYHRYDRGRRRELDITPLHTECNHMDIMAQHLRLLAAGEPLLKPVYDHHDGTFAAPEYLTPRQFMVVEGLLSLTTKAMRNCFAVTVYLDPPEELRRLWKVRRDCAGRGYTPEEVIRELRRREPDSTAFVRPQRDTADIVVRFEPVDGPVDDARLALSMVLRPTISHRGLTELVDKAVADGCGSVRLRLGRDAGHPVDLFDVDPDISAEETAHLESLLWERMDFDHHVQRRTIGVFLEGNRQRQSDPLAIGQLFIAYHLLTAAASVDR